MTEVEHKIFAFSRGEQVPDWLLAQDPQDAQAVYVPLRFCDNVLVVETEDHYLVVPSGLHLHGGGSVLGAVDMHGKGMTIYASGKPVMSCTAYIRVMPQGSGAAVRPVSEFIAERQALNNRQHPGFQEAVRNRQNELNEQFRELLKQDAERRSLLGRFKRAWSALFGS